MRQWRSSRCLRTDSRCVDDEALQATACSASSLVVISFLFFFFNRRQIVLSLLTLSPYIGLFKTYFKAFFCFFLTYEIANFLQRWDKSSLKTLMLVAYPIPCREPIYGKAWEWTVYYRCWRLAMPVSK